MPLPTITATGNATREIELRFTNGGKAVGRLSLACSSGPKDDPKTKTTFLDVTIWDKMAENAAESITTGTSVTVTGRLEQETYEAKDGSGKRTAMKVLADEVAVNLRFATAKVTRPERGQAAPQGDPWNGGPTDDEPF